MKFPTIAILCLLGLLPLLGCGDAPITAVPKPAAANQGKTDFEAILARARDDKKLIFVEFSASWCGPCQEMKHTTFADLKVQAKLDEFVTVFSDTDRDPALAQLFKVRGIPAYFVVRPDRTVVNAASGYKEPDAFMRWLDEKK